MTNYKKLSNAIRSLSMDAVQRANSGHPGMPMGFADVATVLFTEHLKYNPKAPKWAARDRFILSAGHGSMLLYSLLYLTGYEDITIDDIKNFRQLGAKTAGHPEYGYLAGIETTTGPLGQGIANAVGTAMAERMMTARFGDELCGHHTYVAVGDGCLMEGISQEAISLAGHLKLEKLIVLWDDNGITIDGKLEITSSEDQLKRFEAAGWNTQAVDGHDHFEISEAIAKARVSKKPSLIACKTVIGYGSPSKSGTSGCHGSPLGNDEITLAKKELGIDYPAFEIPQSILDEWKRAGERSAEEYKNWKTIYNTAPQEYKRMLAGELPSNWEADLHQFKKQLAETKPKVATRKASENVLNVLTKSIPEMIGGSADLTGSNNTKTASLQPITPQDFSGRYVYYGIREHAMAAIMNGMALYGGFIPYAGTFLVFSDYCRASIRLSALMHQRVIYVMTHDSIGLGEDGPTHQPVEHLASLRAIPNLLVFRPADATETLECWELALKNTNRPSLLALTRQDLPTLTNLLPPPLGGRAGEGVKDNLSSKGGYIVKDCDNPQAVIMATGSEVEIAIKACEKLAEKGVKARVVSIPCFELFDEQSEEYKRSVLGKSGIVRVGIEAAIQQGWDKYIGDNGVFIGMKGFGASAPADELYKKFGITSERVVEAVMDRV